MIHQHIEVFYQDPSSNRGLLTDTSAYRSLLSGSVINPSSAATEQSCLFERGPRQIVEAESGRRDSPPCRLDSRGCVQQGILQECFEIMMF